MRRLFVITAIVLFSLLLLDVGSTAVKRVVDNAVEKGEAIKAMSRILCACATNSKQNPNATVSKMEEECIEQGRKKALDCAVQGNDAVNKCHVDMLQFIHGDCSPDSANCRSAECLKKGVEMQIYPSQFVDATNETTGEPPSTTVAHASVGPYPNAHETVQHVEDIKEMAAMACACAKNVALKPGDTRAAIEAEAHCDKKSRETVRDVQLKGTEAVEAFFHKVVDFFNGNCGSDQSVRCYSKECLIEGVTLGIYHNAIVSLSKVGR